MKYSVNDSCVGCGMCVVTCPQVFFMNDAGTAEAVCEDAKKEDAASAIEAMNGCPVGAISQK